MSLTCGLKLTHDGSVALFDGPRCVFSVEVEKLDNAPRYSPVADLELVPRLLADFDCKPGDVDQWVVDGWDGHGSADIGTASGGQPVGLTVAGYRERDRDLLRPGWHGELALPGRPVPYLSYPHLAGHVAGAYCASPFAAAGEPALVLAWDGGTFPRLYSAQPAGRVASLGALFPLIGHAYATSAHHFGPYRREDEALTVDDLSVAGKLMAYIALGRPRDEIQEVTGETYRRHFGGVGARAVAHRARIGGWGSNAEPSLSYLHAFFRDLRVRLAGAGVSDEDVLASFHQFVEDLLVDSLTRAVRERPGAGPHNLCFVGGCALNIKWNSALRRQPEFADVWVPPFPNDSGSAFGAAAAHLMATTGTSAVDWTVRMGPELRAGGVLRDGWTAAACTPEQLGARLHATGEPVVLLDGRAEVGPRALGGRSIVAAPTDPATKDLLNDVKLREPYRPVAPICLVDDAPAVFDPGRPDPYMLFDHRVRAEWTDRIPAVVHLDGTARLQTVGPEEPTLTRLLGAYKQASGIPVLCNTSANFRGRGFFPDADSAMEWGRIGAVWSEGTLFTREAA